MVSNFWNMDQFWFSLIADHTFATYFRGQLINGSFCMWYIGQYGISPIEYKHFQSNSMLTAIDMIQLWDKCYEDLRMDSTVLWSVSMFLIYESLKKASNEYNQHIVTCMRRSRTFCRAGIPLFWPANYFTRALFRHGGHCLSPRWHCHTDIGPECGISRHCVTSLTACMHILPRYEQCGRHDICQQVYTSRHFWKSGKSDLAPTVHCSVATLAIVVHWYWYLL